MHPEVKKDSIDLFHRYFKIPILGFLSLYFLVWLFSQRVENGLDSYARDTGLLMHMRKLPPSFLIDTHSYAGVTLVVLGMFQKLMYKNRRLHRWVGYTILGVMFTMALSGFFVGAGYSAFQNFHFFSVLFAVPWILWTIGIIWTIKRREWVYHRLIANMMVKGFVAVPLSRILGVIFQRYLDVSQGFYSGIISATLLIGTWQIYELVVFF